MVLLLSALTVQGFVPGPLMISKAPDLLYAAIAGMLAATLILAATGWFMSSIMLRAVSVNRSAVLILALATVILGVYSLNTRIIDVVVMLLAGGLGYLMLRYGYSTAAAALACVLGGELERSLRLGLNLSDGDVFTFVSRPITASILLVTLAILVFGVMRHARMRREMAARQLPGDQA
jgi:putative tricarboxylic transport membrane protein